MRAEAEALQVKHCPQPADCQQVGRCLFECGVDCSELPDELPADDADDDDDCGTWDTPETFWLPEY